MGSQVLSGTWSGLFDVGGKVGERPQNSLTPTVPQGGSAHCRCVSMSCRLHTACTSMCPRYSRLQMLSGRWQLLQKGSSQNPSCYCFLWLQSLPYHLPFPLGQKHPLWTLVSSQQERAVKWLAFPAVTKSTNFAFCPLSMSTSVLD